MISDTPGALMRGVSPKTAENRKIDLPIPKGGI
jgi:hypothetical protein